MPHYFRFIILYHCYSGINTGEVVRRVSGGECDGLRVPAIFPAWLLSDSRQARLGLDTDVMPHTTQLNTLQMVALRAAIRIHLVTGVGACADATHVRPT